MKKDKDILVRLIVKKTPGKIVYSTVRNQRTDFPVLTCAVSCMNGEYRTAIGARPGRAQLYRDDNGLLASGITAESAKSFAAYVSEKTPTESNVRGSAAYRTHLTKVLTERCTWTLGGN